MMMMVTVVEGMQALSLSIYAILATVEGYMQLLRLLFESLLAEICRGQESGRGSVRAQGRRVSKRQGGVSEARPSVDLNMGGSGVGTQRNSNLFAEVRNARVFNTATNVMVSVEEEKEVDGGGDGGFVYEGYHFDACCGCFLESGGDCSTCHLL